MRLQVIAVSSPLSGWLSNSGYELTTNNPDYQVTLRYEKREDIEITTGNSELEKLLVEKLKELGVKRFILNKEGELSDRSIKILIPEMTKYDIDRGVFRALGEFLRVGKSAKRRFISYLLPAVLLLLGSNNLFAQDPWTFIRLWTSSGPVYAADFANNAMRVNLVAGSLTGISNVNLTQVGGANVSLVQGGIPTSRTSLQLFSNTLSADYPGTENAATTAGEPANSVIKFQMNDLSSIAFIFTQIPTTGSYACGCSINNVTWDIASCSDYTTGHTVARGPTFSNPTLLEQLSPNIWSGCNWYRIRQTAHTGPSAIIDVNAVPSRPYEEGWPYTGYNLVGGPQRRVGLGVSNSVGTCDGVDCFLWLQGGNAAPIVGNEAAVYNRTVGNGTNTPVTATWTSATAVDTTLVVTTTGMGQVTCTMNNTGTVSTGTVNFEMSNDIGATYIIVPAVVNYGITAGGPTASNSAALSLSLTAGIGVERPVIGYDRFRLRLNPVITGAGTMNIRCSAGSAVSSRMTAIGQVIPGVGATSLGKAEDAVAANADTGVFILGVRRDAPTTSQTSGSGDYGEIATDPFGAAWTHDITSSTNNVTSTSAAT